MSKTVLVVAGDVSGELHAAAALQALRAREPELQAFGIGGNAMEAAGVELLHHCREMAVFGLPEVLKRYTFFKRVFREMVEEARRRKPDLVLLVDYGGFNLRFAREMKRLGLRVVYYISPQVWASRRSRMKKMVRYVDHLLVIFPFEKKLFEGTGLRVDYVGHPLVDEARLVAEAAPAALPWGEGTRVALLAGSRTQEIRRMLPILLDTAQRVEERAGPTTFIAASLNPETTAVIREVLAGLPAQPASLDVVEGQTREVLRQARAALVVSGTATLEAALMRCPMLVVYKTSALIYALARLAVQVPHIGMVNVLAEREVCPEFIQHDATAEALAEALPPLLEEGEPRRLMLAALDEVAAKLGPGGAADQVAAHLANDLTPSN